MEKSSIRWFILQRPGLSQAGAWSSQGRDHCSRGGAGEKGLGLCGAQPAGVGRQVWAGLGSGPASAGQGSRCRVPAGLTHAFHPRPLLAVGRVQEAGTGSVGREDAEKGARLLAPTLPAPPGGGGSKSSIARVRVAEAREGQKPLPSARCHRAARARPAGTLSPQAFVPH